MKLPTKLRSLPVGRAGMPCFWPLLEVLWELAITCCNWLCSFSQTPIPPFIQSAWLPHTQLQLLLLTLLGVPITNICFNPSSHVSGRPGETMKGKRNASLGFQTLPRHFSGSPWSAICLPLSVNHFDGARHQSGIFRFAPFFPRFMKSHSTLCDPFSNTSQFYVSN